jgi:Zn-dependent peptidase ImmA (M78 family)/transcriptional regulator with XRE-family HTH domain
VSGIGEALETARLAKGLTQAELAARVGITQAALSRYEHGLRKVEGADLERLAEELDVTPKLLEHAGRRQGAIAVNAHMRRNKTAKPTIWKMLEAQLNILRLRASSMFGEIEVNTVSQVPTFDPIDYSPADAARLTRSQWRMPMGPVRNLTQWMESAGVLVFEQEFAEGARVDGMSQWVDSYPIVLINCNVPVDRKRWTLAHELGHLVLHTEYLDEDVEVQANQFAAEFLMPEDEIRPSLRNPTLGNFLSLKREWGVSIAALVERAFALQVIDKTKRTSFYKMMSARGMRTVEPGSESLAPETPQLASYIAKTLLSQGLSEKEIAYLAGFPSAAQNVVFDTGQKKTRLRAV